MAGRLSVVARWVRRRWWLVGLALLLVVGQAWLLVRWKTSAWRAYPGRPEIRRLEWYLVYGPRRLLLHLAVPVGTRETRLRASFGVPALAADTDGEEWKRHIGRYRQAGWSVPAPPLTERALVYEVVDGGEMVLVYYFLTPQGHVAAVFVGET